LLGQRVHVEQQRVARVLFDDLAELVLIEAAVPGVDRKDVTVECADGAIVISGIQRGRHGSNERTYSGEIPYGPFYRALHVPFPMRGEAVVDLDRGLLRVRLKGSPTNKNMQEATPQSK